MTSCYKGCVALYAGASGFSYPSWRGGWYPADARPEDFLRLYAERLPSVELNTTGYRLPSEEQFERWAAATPPGFRFSVKMPARGLRALADFEARVRRLGDRLGPVRIVVQQARDEGFLTYLLGSVSPDVPYALDFRDDSWAGVDVAPAVVVDGDDRAAAPFRYLRFRDPPYDDDALGRIADRVRPLVASGVDVYAYFRHEEEPTAPRYAERLVELIGRAA
jgi:uncharacterized protein YecE (DUF72 family)